MSRHGIDARESEESSPFGGTPWARGQSGGPGSPPDTGPLSTTGAQPVVSTRPARRPSGVLASWPIRRKLAALVALPILGIVGAAVFVGASAVGQLRDARTTQSLAQLAGVAYDTKVALQQEREESVLFLEGGGQVGQRNVKARRLEVDSLIKELTAALNNEPIGGWPNGMDGATVRVAGMPERLGALRSAIDGSLNASSVVIQYDDVFEGANSVLDVVTDSIQAFRSEPDSVRLAGIIHDSAAAVDTASTERDQVYLVLKEGRLTKKRFLDVQKWGAEQDQLLRQVEKSVTTVQQKDTLSQIRNNDSRLAIFRTDLGSIVDAGTKPGVAGDENAWLQASTARLNRMNTFVDQAIKDTEDETTASVRSDLWSTSLYVAIGLLATLLMVLAVTAIARSIDLPMRRLRSGAVHLASVQLPAAVRKVEEEGPDAAIELSSALPRGVPAGPETVDLASAVDELSSEALRLASSQVRLRRALDDAFVSMSRRSQSMVEKQLSIIDELESTEQDPEQLRNLFRLDHLAARMRRYNDNLLVLAGSQVRTRSSAPVPVAELFRAATSEMEQYERVRLQPVGGASLAGPSAGGLIHLLAELLDNAAMYSPPTSPIVLSAAFTPEGGLLLEVADSGVGIPPAELERINQRLSAPQEMDTQVPSRMGLFVVGRLAHRGGFTVRLSQRDSGPGTVAEVIVPPALVLGAPGSTGEQPRVQSAPALPVRPTAQPPQPQMPAMRPFEPAAAASEPETGGAVAPAAGPAGGLPRRPTRSGAGAGIAGAFQAGQNGPNLFAGASNEAGTNGSGTPPRGVEPFGSESFGRGEPFGREPFGREPAAREPQREEPVTREPHSGGLPVVGRDAQNEPAQSPAPPLPTRGAGPALPSPQQWPPTPIRPMTAQPGPAQQPVSGPIPGIGGRKDSNVSAPLSSTGRAPGAWDQQLPTELAARAVSDAQLGGYRQVTPDAPLIGSLDPVTAEHATTPIFDSISAWFTDPAPATMQPSQTPGTPPASKEAAAVVDLRERPAPAPAAPPAAQPARPSTPTAAPAPAAVPAPAPAPAQVPAAAPAAAAGSSSRWAALGDQRWIAANARAASAPEVAGKTDGGLPRRRPGANLLPTASAAAPAPTRPGGAGPSRTVVPGAGAGPDAEAVRGRLGSYQRGLSSARQARRRPGDPSETVAAGLFAAGGNAGQGEDSGQGGEQ